MKKIIAVIILVLTSISYSQRVVRTDFPYITNSKLLCTVIKENNSGYYYYSYSIINGISNKGEINIFEIDVNRSPNTIEIDTVGLRFFNKYNKWIEHTNLRGYQRFYGKITPVGFPVMPNKYWEASIENNYKEAEFDCIRSPVQPGDTICDIVMMSKGLPGLRWYKIRPEFSSGEYVLTEEEDTNMANADTVVMEGDTLISPKQPPIYRGNIDSVEQSLAINGLIVGPISPPLYFNPTIWCDTLTSYTTQSISLRWIKDQTTANKYLGYFSSARAKLVQSDSVGARNVLLQVLSDVNVDSTSILSSEAYSLLRFNTEYLVNKLPQAQTASFFAVKLVSSTGMKLTSGSLQYYDGSWKNATNNQDGTFGINTSLKTLSLRMTYEYGTQTKSNVSISTDTIVFRTVNTQVQLQNSNGTLIDTGSVQYYAGAWRILGTTTNGVASKELLPASYSFRMTYAYASNDKQQNLDSSSTVIFKTTNAQVQLQNSSGALIDTGIVQYYSGAWRDLGTTSNGVATKELLPNNYSFRMNYAYASKDKQQDISANPTVIFQTVNAAVQLQNSQSVLMDQGTVQYYSGAWRNLGVTSNGIATKELLPNSYSFRMNYAYASKDKQQEISSNPIVIFQTVNAAVQLINSSGALMDTGAVQYYSGAWRSFGTTVSGVANKELLPNSYSFRMMHQFISLDKTQDVSANSTVTFATVLCTINAKDAQSNPLSNAQASYYSGAWRVIGLTTNGQITKELLPVSLTFRISYNSKTQDKTQNLSTNNIVDFVAQ